VRGSDVAIGVLAVAALFVAFGLVLRPPDSSESWAKDYASAMRDQYFPPTAEEPTTMPE
jgi:hypothetical protein